jgi:PAS domain S-box-containing protein
MATILIADDRPLNRQYLVTLLGHFGHRLIEVSDGEEALETARAEHPQLVISDLVMPKIDGEELARRLHEDPKLAGIPIILYSASYSVPQAEVVSRAVNAFAVLPKPSDPEVTVETVNRALGLLPLDITSAPVGAAVESTISTVAGKFPKELATLEAISYRLATLIEMSLELATEREPGRLLLGSAHMARKLIGARFAAIGIPGADGQTSRCFIARSSSSLAEPGNQTETNDSGGDLIKHVDSPCPGSILDRVLTERRPIRLPKVTASQLGAALPASGGERAVSFLAVPLQSSSRFLGWLHLLDKFGEEEFSSEDERVAATLAGQVGVAYERLEELRRAEEALRRSRSTFETLFESAPDGMVATDLEGRIVRVNTQMEKMFGYRREELVGQRVETLVPERLREAHAGHRQDYYHEPRLRPMGAGELFARRKDATRFPVDIMLSPMQTEHGSLVLSVVRDVTKRKEAEERIVQLNQELEQRVAELQVANESLASFSYSVYHDLRAPLRQIDGFATILVEDFASQLHPTASSYLHTVREGAQKMGRMVDDLLNLARLDRRQMELEVTPLNSVVDAVVKELQPECAGRHIEWDIGSLPAEMRPGPDQAGLR